MKKMIIIAVCLATSIWMRAQSVQFGLKAGVNISHVKVENEPDFESRAGMYVGGLAHIHVSPHFAVQPEIFYSSQGGKKNAETLKLGYINIPVLMQYMTGNGLRLQTGPQLGIAVSGEDEYESVTNDFKGHMKTGEFGWVVGASYQFPGSGLGIDARYTLGLSNARNDGGDEINNRVFGIGLFYQFMPTKVRH